MQIALVRHGKPLADHSRASRHDIESWLEAYDRAGIDPAYPPPFRLRAIAAASEYVLSSDLPRAVESLRTLAPEIEAPAESLFREASLPGLAALPMGFGPSFEGLVTRAGWLLGWSPVTERFSDARRRARAAARELSALAEAHDSVMLVGHGIFNTLIARAIRAAGWDGPKWPTGTYWSSAVYRKRRR